jgi:hypothetical protein
MKAGAHVGPLYVKDIVGHAANAILTADRYNLRLVPAWLRMFLRLILTELRRALAIYPTLKSACWRTAIQEEQW